MSRPGIVIYFDMMEPLQKLTDSQRGKLLLAMMEYGKEGAVPEFKGTLALAWGFVQSRLERDAEAYKKTVEQRNYANYCKKRKQEGLEKASFEEWLGMESDSEDLGVRELPAGEVRN